MKIKYYENLDGLRGIAALMVVIFHFFFSDDLAGYSPNILLYRKITEFGQHGVSLFFVLSGFVITRILINAKDKRGYFKNFYIRRALRIFPLYYFSLIIWYFLMPIILHTNFTPFKLQWPFYIYLNNILKTFSFPAVGPPALWTLAIEEHFYLIWPLIVYFIPSKSLIWVILFFVLSSFLFKYYFLTHGLDIRKFTLTRWDQIVIGAGIVLLERKGFFKIHSNFKYVVSFTILIIFPSIYIYIQENNFLFFKELFKYFLLAMFFGCLICLLLFENRMRLVNNFIELPIMQRLGKISYGIYVWHLFIFKVVPSFFLTKILLLDMAIIIFLTLFVAQLSFKFIEEPFLKFKNKFS